MTPLQVTYEHGLQQLLEFTERPAEECTLLALGTCPGLEELALNMGIGHVECLDEPRRLPIYQGRCPNLVLGDAVVDSIYCLSDLLADLLALNPRMPMLFPAPNLRRRRLVRRLRKEQLQAEKNNREKRKAFIAKIFPDMSESQCDLWAGQTRGLDYDDVLRAVDSESPNLLRDPYATCDPETGRWHHRLLPLDDYRQLLAPYDYRLDIEYGFPPRRPWRSDTVLLYMTYKR